MAEISPPAYLGIEAYQVPLEKVPLTQDDQTELAAALKRSFSGLAASSVEIRTLFKEVLVTLAGLPFVGKTHALYSDWSVLFDRTNVLLVASKDSASTMSASMKMFMKTLVPLIAGDDLSNEKKIEVMDKFLAQNEKYIATAKKNSEDFHKLVVDIETYTLAFETFGAEKLAAFNKNIEGIETTIKELQDKLYKLTMAAGIVAAAAAPVGVALMMIPVAGPVLAALFSILSAIFGAVALLEINKTKDEIKEQQEKLVKVKADKASLEETQKQLKEMKVDKIDLITKNLKLFEAAWNQFGTACVQLKELVQTGKSLVGIADEPVIQQALDLFRWLIVCLDGYSTGMEKLGQA